MSLGEFAPAKVNLFLHVGAARPDGFHPLSSLMVFADLGDRLYGEPADRFSLAVDGPFAAHAPLDEGNLVTRAARLIGEAAGLGEPRQALRLVKEIPAGAGLGGGSSDAAAALRLLNGACGLGLETSELEELAGRLGSDVPACVAARPVLAEGRGERLSPAPGLPALPAVLVWPGVMAATARVYRAFDEMGANGSAAPPVLPTRLGSPGEAAAFLAGCRNDLEAAACATEPEIAEVLELLRQSPETRLARMSGSGSACFALCEDDGAAQALAARVAGARPAWWARPCGLGG